MNFRAHTVYLVLSSVFILFMLSSCNDHQVTGQISTQQYLLSQAKIQPETIILNSVNSSDTTISISISVVVSDTSLLKNTPQFSIEDIQTQKSSGQGSLSSYDSATKRFSGNVSLKVATMNSQEFQLTIYGIDKFGNLTNTILGIIRVTGLAGQPPVIVYATNPDTVKIPASGTYPFDFKAKVTDPNGESAIDRVLVDLMKDGSTSKSTFQLYDDGSSTNLNGSTSGDQVAGDSIFTRRFQIDSNTTPNNFTLKFYAIGKNGLSSDTVVHHMVIVK